MSEQGRKYDSGKLRYDLIPVLALEDMVKGLTFGTIKYDDNNWVKVPNGRKRYLAAAMRHIQEYRKGVLWDEEQDIHHLSAAMNNLSFIVEKDLRGWGDNSEEPLEEVTEFQTEEDLFSHGKYVARFADNGDISEDTLKNYVNTLNVKVVDGKFEVTPKLWYPSVEYGGNPWIEYDGGGQPVRDGVQVVCMELQERLYESMIHECATSAEDNNWVWRGKDGDTVRADLNNIVAYRVV